MRESERVPMETMKSKEFGDVSIKIERKIFTLLLWRVAGGNRLEMNQGIVWRHAECIWDASSSIYVNMGRRI